MYPATRYDEYGRDIELCSLYDVQLQCMVVWECGRDIELCSLPGVVWCPVTDIHVSVCGVWGDFGVVVLAGPLNTL